MVERADVPVFKNDPVMVLVLGFLTCGLYLIYWNIKIAGVINAASGREVISQPIAALSGCCMPVNAYFYYLCGQSLDDVGRLSGEGKLSDKSVLLLVLGIFVPMVSAMIVQGHVNAIYDGPSTY
jgi:hypothetical protein